MYTVKEYWSEVLKILENEMTPVAYETWILPLKPISLIDDTFTVEVLMPFSKNMIETRHSPIIQTALKIVLKKDINLKIVLPNEGNDPVHIVKEEPVINISNKMNDSGVLPKYVFENFIVGNSNRMAHAAAVAVSEDPGGAYNPLFLYGGVGLGKTHLMHAIANEILKNNPSSKVLYVSCEKFTNELITAIRENKNNEFRDKYRQIDVLLIDDIQFISEKTYTQEEFFHTFNALWLDGKQIIISSDRPPTEIQNLTDRLSSRLSGGLIADIKFPDFETRTAILEKKAEQEGIILPKEVLQYIAQSIKSNIRELEGALIRVIAYARLTNKPIDIELAEDAIKDILKSGKPEINVEYIQELVGEHYGFKAEELKSKRKTQPLATARQVAMYLCRKILDESLVNIGKKFGGRDHTTVIHGCDKINDMIENDSNFQKTLLEIEKKITG